MKAGFKKALEENPDSKAVLIINPNLILGLTFRY